MYSMASLILHEVSVPAPVRVAVKAAMDGPIDERRERLRSAARMLFLETDLECSDVKELLDLESSPDDRCDCAAEDYAMLEARA